MCFRLFYLFCIGNILVAASEEIVKPKWTNLIVTLSSDPQWAFSSIPLDFWEADRQGWRATSENCTNNGAFNGYRFIPKSDDAIAGLYDINGILSGFQMLPKKNKIMVPDNVYQFEKQPMFQSDSILGVDVLALTAYFVNPSTICRSGRTANDLKADGLGSGLWFQNGPSADNLVTVPRPRSDAIDMGWRENTCLAMMGQHSFFKSDAWDESSCSEFLPAWVFYDLNKEISGFGFLVSGFDDSPRFQHVQGILLQHMLGEHSSECAGQLADSVGVTSINIYFDASPENIVCEIPEQEE